MAVIEYDDTSKSIHITGPHKSIILGTCASSSVLTRASGDTAVADDIGRFVLWQKDTALAETSEIRYITNVDGNDITVEDGFSETPASGDELRMSTNLEDLTVAMEGTGGEAAAVYVTKHGMNFYDFGARDWTLIDRAFLADVDKSLHAECSDGTFLFMSVAGTGCTALQFGRLRGGGVAGKKSGESNNTNIGANNIETIGGCYLSLKSTNSGGGSSVFNSSNAAHIRGGVVNFYGCLIESVQSANINHWRFFRMRNAARFIGCIFDGVYGGRFYNAYSEFADTRISGNTNPTVAWSIGATFHRPVDSLKFFQGDTALKNYQNFSGTFRNVTITDSMTDMFKVQGDAGSLINFVDCTTLSDSDIQDGGNGTIRQIKSVNYTFADVNGTALDSARIAIYDSDGLLQNDGTTTTTGGIKESVAANAGAAPEILPVFYMWTDNDPGVYKSPFDIRIRKYGKIYQDFSSTISSPIKQEYRLPTNTVTVLGKDSALGLSGVAVDFAAKTVTITAALSLSQIYDFCQIHLQLDAQMDDVEFFKSTDGVTFTFNTDWKLILGTNGDITGATGKTLVVSGTGVVQLNHAGNNIDNLTITGNALLAAVITGDMTNITVTGDLTFGAVGTYNLVNSTIGVIKNSSGGNVALNSANTTITTNTGPNITITTSASLTLTGLLANTEVRIYSAGTTTELGGVENSGTSFTLAGITVSAVDIQIHALAHLNQRLTSIATTSDSTIPITQLVDRQYLNPS